MCPDCGTGRLFLYDSSKKYDSRTKLISMLEYDAGHRPAAEEPVAGTPEPVAEPPATNEIQEVLPKLIYLKDKQL